MAAVALFAFKVAAFYVANRLVQSIGAKDQPATTPADIQLMGTQEGDPIAWFLGPEVRVGGQVLFKSPVRAFEQGGGGGGCGGGPQSPSQYAYYADVAISFGQPPPGSRIVQIDKLWFDGKVGWKFDPDISITSTLLTASVYTIADGQTGVLLTQAATPFVSTRVFTTNRAAALGAGSRVVIAGNSNNPVINGTWTLSGVTNSDDGQQFVLPVSSGTSDYEGNGTITKQRVLLQITSPLGGPDLSQFRAGHDVVVSGYTGGASANNGTYNCFESNLDPATGISFIRLENPNAVAAVSGTSITLSQDLPQFNPKYFTTVTVHDGSQWQLPDSLLEATLGVGNVPGYRGLVYATFENMNLTAFGDRIPNVNALIRVETSMTLDLAIAALMERADFRAEEYDVSALSAIPIRGYQVKGIVTTASCLSAIMTTFSLVAFVDSSTSKIKFVRRTLISPISIPARDLVATTVGGDAPRKSKIKEVRERTLPREYSVNYFNALKDYQNGNEPFRLTDARGDSPEVFDSGVTMTPSNAQSLAKILLFSNWANRQVVEIRLPPSYAYLSEGSVLSFTDLGRTWTILAAKIDFNLDGTIVVTGPQDEAAALTYAGDPATGGGTDTGGPGILESLDLQIMDIPPLASAHVDRVGLYFGVCPRSADRVYPGSQLFSAPDDDDADFVSVADVNIASAMGRTGTTLGSGVNPYMIDRKNSVDVTIETSFTPQSISEEDLVSSGKNVVLVGNEILAYGTATLIGTNQYRLSLLVRGLRDTEDQMALHTQQERVVFLGGGSRVNFLDLSTADVGADRYFRAVPNGGVVEDYASVLTTFAGNTVRPFTVTAVKGVRDGSGNLTVTWDRQTRSVVKMFSTNAIPLDDSRELYEIEVWNAANTAMLRLLTSSSPTVAYSAANQTTDFGSTQASVNLRIYKIGDIVGRGRVRRVAV